MATIVQQSTKYPAKRDRIPPLASGDRLTRAEFERRYEAMPHVKAELVEGVVYVQAAVRYTQHGNPHWMLISWMGAYSISTPGTNGGDNSSIRLDMDNEPQPDIVMRIDAKCGGSSEIDQDGYLTGVPELVAEIAASSASYDLHDKLHAYRRNGVREYLVWRVLDEAFDWFVLREGRYEQLQAEESGLIKSEVFPGLWLDTAAMLRGDLAAAVASLQPGLKSEAHAEFVKRLSATKSEET